MRHLFSIGDRSGLQARTVFEATLLERLHNEAWRCPAEIFTFWENCCLDGSTCLSKVPAHASHGHWVCLAQSKRPQPVFVWKDWAFGRRSFYIYQVISLRICWYLQNTTKLVSKHTDILLSNKGLCELTNHIFWHLEKVQTFVQMWFVFIMSGIPK